MNSIDYWYNTVTKNECVTKTPLSSFIKNEQPNIISATFERACNLQCAHCIYPQDTLSKELSEKYKFNEVITNLISQISVDKNPILIHEGRIILPRHIEILKNLKINHPKVKIGLIDNGTYIKVLKHIKTAKLEFDWLDISIDGLKETHNQQRDPIYKKSWNQAIEGLANAKEIVKKNGRVSTLMTLSILNYLDISKLADYLLGNNNILIDELHITPMVPKQPNNYAVNLDQTAFDTVWSQFKEIFKKYNTESKYKCFFKMYNIEDITKLAKSVGLSNIQNAILGINTNKPPILHNGSITFFIENIPITYFPSSIWPQESIFIDADVTYRVAYAHQFTLRQLRMKPELKKFTVTQITPESNLQEIYEQTVDHWWQYFGKEFLQKEQEIFKAILEK